MQGSKVVLPNPHVTMRRKNTLKEKQGEGGSMSPSANVLRRSTTGSVLTQNQGEDPMASTLQKWREQVSERDLIAEEDD